MTKMGEVSEKAARKYKTISETSPPGAGPVIPERQDIPEGGNGGGE
jgi:hypothetical protein